MQTPNNSYNERVLQHQLTDVLDTDNSLPDCYYQSV